jgi:hypothetical protein
LITPNEKEKKSRNGGNYMNVKISARQRLTQREQKELDKYIFDKAMEIYNGESMGLMRRCYKTIAVALNEQFGFGKNRLIKLFDGTSDIAKMREKDEIFWQHVDNVVIKQIGLPFEREEYSGLEE